MKRYPSFAAALQDSEGYEAQEVVDLVAQKTEAFVQSLASTPPIRQRQTVQNVLALSHAAGPDGLHVLELGGGCGATYHELDHLIPGRVRRWWIVETPLMAAAGRQRFESAVLRFFSDLDEAAASLDRFDLFVAQGSLQYLPDPLEALGKIVALHFRDIYLSRTVMTRQSDRPVFTRQQTRLRDHGPGNSPSPARDRETTVPLVILPRDRILSLLRGAGYGVVFDFEETQPGVMWVGDEPVTVELTGLMLRRASE